MRQRYAKTFLSLHPPTVVSLTPFDNMEEAVRLANDSDYSLSAGLWTSNLHEAMTYGPRIRAASLQVNGATVYVETAIGNVRANPTNS